MVLEFFLAAKKCVLHQSRFPDSRVAFNPENSVVVLKISPVFPFPKRRGFEQPLTSAAVG